MNAHEYQAPESVNRVQRAGWFVGAVALIAAIFGAITSPDKFYQSYLMAYLLVLGLTLGSLGLLMLQHLTGGNWGIIIRRPLEAAAQNIWLVFLMFVPVVLGMNSLYRAWMDPELRKADPLSPLQQWYLTASGFLIRAVLYFAIWFALIWIFNRWSQKQDIDQDDRGLRRSFKLLAGPGIILYVVAMTFASIDWAMSLSPHWASTIYGFIFVAGQAVSAMSLMIAVVVLLSGSEPFAGILQKRHLHDLGKLLFAFNMLWAYFDFSQLLIIWSGNLPEEITFYRTRLSGGWGVVAVTVLVFEFAVPFLLLLSEDVKRNPRVISKIALWMIFMRLVDMFWTTRPELSARVSPTWLDIVVPVALIGLWVGFFARNLKQRPLLPLGDPKLEEAIAQHEH
jgi:hypothetical protein